MTSCCSEPYQRGEHAEHDDLDHGGQPLVERERGGQTRGDCGCNGHGGPLHHTLPHGRVVRLGSRSRWTYRRTIEASTLRVMAERITPGDVFAERLAESIRRAGIGKGEFAERAGVDRTTLSQLLSPGNRRLPRLDTVLALAAEHDMSIDWLVGLSNVGPLEAEIIQHTSFEAPGPSPTDERLLGWLSDAAEFKIRYVPATVPDLLKSDAVIRYERSGSVRSGCGADHRHDRGPPGVGAQPGHGDGVLLVGAGAAVVRRRRGRLGPPRRGGTPGAARADDRARRRAVPDVPLVPLRRAPSATPRPSPCSAASAPRCTSASCTSC